MQVANLPDCSIQECDLLCNKVEMCFKTITSYQSERAIVVHTENLPLGKVDKDLLYDFKEFVWMKTDLTQSRPFQVCGKVL